MRPYLAVIVDSFRAALASRILWVAMLAIWLLLAALAPIAYREVFTTNFRGQDFYNGTQMKAMLARGLVDPAQQDAPAGRIAAAMPDDVRRQLRRVGEGDEVRIRLNQLADALNELIVDDSGWYDAEAWQDTVRLKELRELDATDASQLSDELRRRRARLRIEAALPGVFAGRAPRSIMLTYAGLDFPAEFEIDKAQFIILINQWVVPTIINWLLGFILVFLGILVTAHLIPDMLQPGSLHLLLSKPVSRTYLFLSKFVGGCAFVCLCVIQLVVGLYLIAGLRLDVWNARVLWCIPVSVFLFSVFYSVSAVVGLRWRSPILAIGVTCMFGLACFVIGFIGGLFDGLVTRPEAIQHLAITGETLIGSTRGGGLVRLDRSQDRWVELFKSSAMTFDRVLAPVPLDDQRVATARVRNGRINPFGSGALDLLVLSQSDDWNPEPSLRLPTSTTRLLRCGDDQVLAMNSGSLYITHRADILDAANQPASVDDEQPQRPQGEGSGGASWLSKLTNMMGDATAGFRPVLPRSTSITPPRGLVVDSQGEWIVLLSRGRLSRWEPTAPGQPDQAWRQTVERQLEGDPSREFVIAASGNVLMVAWPEAPVECYTTDSLQPLGTVELPDSTSPVSAVGLGDGLRFVLLNSDARCHLITLDPQQGVTLENRFSVRDVESIHFESGQAKLYLVHDIDRIDVFDSKTLDRIEPIRPSLSGWRLVDRYLVTPLRILTPQTGELGETIAAMVSGKSAVAIDDGGDRPEYVRYNIVRPVLSCAGFVAFMLTVGSVYFTRRDF